MLFRLSLCLECMLSNDQQLINEQKEKESYVNAQTHLSLEKGQR